MDSIFDVPAHPLLVHIPVVCVPLAALGAVLVALRPGWRRPYGPIVVFLAGLGAVGGVVAAASGESLQESRRIRDLGDHGELGELARNVAFVLFVLVAAWIALDRWHTRPRVARVPTWVAPVLTVLVVLASIGGVVAVVAAGHSGAERAWEDEGSAPALVGTPTR